MCFLFSPFLSGVLANSVFRRLPATPSMTRLRRASTKRYTTVMKRLGHFVGFDMSGCRRGIALK
jgi:hypothetical protein